MTGLIRAKLLRGVCLVTKALQVFGVYEPDYVLRMMNAGTQKIVCKKLMLAS